MNDNVEKIDLNRVDWKSSREFFESLGEALDKLEDSTTLLGLVNESPLLRLVRQLIRFFVQTWKLPKILTIQRTCSSLATTLTH